MSPAHARPAASRGRGAVGLALLFGLFVASSPPAAPAASAKFFWAGVHAPELSEPERSALARAAALRFGASQRGAFHRFLRSLDWDELEYYGADLDALLALQEKRLSNRRSVYGAYLSLDRVMTFEPTELEARESGLRAEIETTYVLGTLNVFHLETRNVVHSRPFYITYRRARAADSVTRSGSLTPLLSEALDRFAGRVEDPAHPYTAVMREQLQDYFGAPGEDRVAIRRRTQELRDTYGVVSLNHIRIVDAAQSARGRGGEPREIPVSRKTEEMLRDLAFYGFSHQLAKFRQVTPVRGHADKLTGRTREIVAATSDGDVELDAAPDCVPLFDDSGTRRFCVRIPPPRNPVRLSLQIEREPVTIAGVRAEGYWAYLDFAVEDPETGRRVVPPTLKYFRHTPRPRSARRLSDHYYAESVMGAMSELDEARLSR